MTNYLLFDLFTIKGSLLDWFLLTFNDSLDSISNR